MVSLDDLLTPQEINNIKNVKECGDCFFIFNSEEENCPFCNSDYIIRR
jgi:rRNA maturation endonuclease Nob1